MSAVTNIPAPEIVAVPPGAAAENAEFRSRVGKISRHSVVYFAGILFTAGAGYFFKIYVARSLGAEALGIYALGMSIVNFMEIFNAAGVPTAGTRFVAEYSAQRDYARLGAFLRGGLTLLGVGNLLLGGVVLILVPWIGLHLYHTPALSSYSWTFAALMLLGVLNLFLGHCMAGFGAVARRTVVTQFSGTTATIILASIAIGLHFGLAGYLVAQVASSCLVLLLLAKSVWGLMPRPARTQGGFGHFEKRVVAFSATAFAIAFVNFVLAYADKITLGWYLNAREVGIYAVAISVGGFVPIALTSVNQIFSPTIAELHSAANYSLLQRLYASLTKWVIIVTAPLALTVVIFSGAIMTVFGSDFRSGGIVLMVGAVAQMFNCGVGSVGFLLLMSGNQIVLMKIQAANAALMVILNLLLVPRLGILGAALACGIAVAGTNMWALMEVRRRLGLFPYGRSYLKLIVPAMLTLLVLLAQRAMFTHQSWRAAAAAMVSAYVVFMGTLWLIGVAAEDRMLGRMVWDKMRRIYRVGEPNE